MVDVSKDFFKVDGLRPVTVVLAVSGEEVPVEAALRRAISTREAAQSSGAYTQSDVRWHLGVGEFQMGKEPAVGAMIVDGKDVWTVLDVQLAAMQSRFACMSRLAKLNPDAAELATIEKPQRGQDEDGVQFFTFVPSATGVQVWIEPMELTVGVTPDKRRIVKSTHRMYCANSVEVEAGWRVVMIGDDGEAQTFNVARATHGRLAMLKACDLVLARVVEED